MPRPRKPRFGTLRLLAMLAIAVGFVLLSNSFASDGRRVSAAGYLLVAAGAALNLLVTCANGGRMPADTAGRPRYAGHLPGPHYPGHAPMTPRTRLRYLGDYIPVPTGLASPGDVLLLAGTLTATAGGLFLHA